MFSQFILMVLHDVIFQAWRSHNQGRNNMANRYNREGIYVTHSSRAFRDEEGKSFWVDIEIVDGYRVPSGSLAPYNVTVSPFHASTYMANNSLVNQIF